MRKLTLTIIFIFAYFFAYMQTTTLPVENIILKKVLYNWNGDTLIATYSGSGNIFTNLRRPLDSADAVPLMTLSDSLSAALVASKISFDPTGTIYDSTNVQGALEESSRLISNITFNNIVYVKNEGENPIQTKIDSLKAFSSVLNPYLLLLDQVRFNDTVEAHPFIALAGLGDRKTIIKKLIYKSDQNEITSIKFQNLNFEQMNIELDSAHIPRFVFFDNCQIIGDSLYVVGQNNIFHNIQFRGFNVGPDTSIISKVFFDSQFTTWSNGFTLKDSAIFQQNSAELNGNVVIESGSELYVRTSPVGAFPELVFASFEIEPGGLLDIDGLTYSTSVITGNDEDIFLLDGDYGGLAGSETLDVDIIDNGDGTVDIPDYRCFLYNNDHYFGKPRVYRIPAVNNVLLTDNETNYFQVNYNGGDPVWEVTTTRTSNLSDIICFRQAFREGANIEFSNVVYSGQGLAEKIVKIEEDRGVQIISGLLLSSSGLNFSVSSGSTKCGINIETFTDFNSAVTTFREYTPTGGVYSYTLENTLNNTNYVSGGNLVSLLPNKYTVNWVWAAENDNDLYFTTIHNVQYSTLETALTANVNDILAITGFPNIIKEFSVFLGGVIYGTNGVVGVIIERGAARGDAPSSIDHNSTSNKQGGEPGFYGHTTLVQNNRLVNFADSVNSNEIDPIYIADTSNIVYLDQINTLSDYLIIQQPGQILSASDTATNAGTIYNYVENREAPFFEYELTADSQNNFSVGFTIKIGAKVYYAGNRIDTDRWSGEGTTTLVLAFPTYKYDKLIIDND